MSEIPTIEVKTPFGGNAVVLKQFITGFDDEAIEEIYTSGKHRVEAPDPKAAKDPSVPKPKQEMEFDGSVIQRAEREGVKRVVVSVDGQTENVLDLVYNMRSEDTKFVKAEVDKIINPPEADAKKK